MYAGFAAQGKKIWALCELTPRTVEKFNDAYSDRRGVRFSALVGKAIPFTCQSPSAGDGVVTIGSARFKIMDWKYSNSVAHTDLTSRADFGNFVFPRLSVGPRGNHDPELLSAGTETVNEGDDVAAAERASGDTYSIFRNAAYARDNATGDDEEESPMGDADLEGLTLAKEVVVKAKQLSEIDINFSGGLRSSVTFVAPPNVSATLVDSAGVVIGGNAAGSPESRLMFRTITIEGPAAGGTVKLRFENKGATESRVFVAAFTERQPSVPEVIAYARPLMVRANGSDWSSVGGRNEGR
jgi:hypothetical protein